ncbi:spermidine/putrescine ABC transporter membrane protein [compost metagenome]
MIASHLKKLPLPHETSLQVLAYLYLPMLVLIAHSFNANRTATVWTEFSFAWYGASWPTGGGAELGDSRRHRHGLRHRHRPAGGAGHL